MADGFTRDKFAWLDRIAGDARVSDRAFRVAYVIAAQFLNRKSGEAWPSQQTLAAACGTNDRRVRDALRDLVDNGHLISRRGGRLSGGGGSPNHYEPVFNRTEPSDRKAASTGQPRPNENFSTGQSELFDRTNSAISTGHQRPTNPLKEPTEEPTERNTRAADEFDAFWSAYPRKVEKGAARRAYATVLKAGKATGDDLLAGALRYAAERAGQDPKFTKHAARWLNAECWLDEQLPSRGGQHPRWAEGLADFVHGETE
jgi:hypothetical protein